MDTQPTAHPATDAVSPWVARWAPLLPAGEVLDLACGGGRHARHLAALGHAVLAVDRDPAALALAVGPGIATLQADLEDPALAWPFGAGRFAAIVVTNYLHRPLFPKLKESLAPGGVLLYETFAEGNEAYGKPSNPAFLLRHGELLGEVHRLGLHAIAYEDGFIAQPKPAMVQRLCAAKSGFPPENGVLDRF